MCGIFGSIVFKDIEIKDQEIVKARQSLVHRGPDDFGLWVSEDRRVALAHTRLSILDLDTRSRQPFRSGSGKSLLTFNGEIYNYRDLKATLRRQTLRTTSDTEVLVEFLEQEGAKSLNALNGMFAFGFLFQNQLLLAVDPAGQKPLYTYWDGRLFAFSSEIKAFRALSKCHLEVDNDALVQYMVHGYVPLSRTSFRHVRKLPGGHFQLIDLQNGPQPIKKYWDLPKGERLKIKYPEAKEELKRIISCSVKRHLHADVPVGAFLSGGVDSSVVSCEAARLLAPHPLYTFSASFPLEERIGTYDESRYAKIVSEKILSRHHVVSIDPHRSDLHLILKHFDEPFADSSCIPTSQLCAETVRTVKVALSGDGGDELFGGYRRLRAAIWTERYRSLSHLIALINPIWSRSRNHILSSISRFGITLRHNLFERLNIWNMYFTEDDLLRTLSRNRENLFCEALHWEKSLADLEVGERILHFNFKTYLFSDLLPKIDRMSMLHGLEIRCPFLDKQLIDFAFRLPTDFKLTSWTGKKILKDTYRSELSSEIVDRSKKGFGFPIERLVSEKSQEIKFKFVQKYFPHLPDTFSSLTGRNRYQKYFALLSLEDNLGEIYERTL